MALNKYMHPRNVYKSQKPNFRKMAELFPFFKEVASQDEEGRVTLDFKMPSHLAALSKALMLQDFNLQIEYPLDRLVPTIPLRVNYILWLEDIIKFAQVKETAPPLEPVFGLNAPLSEPYLTAVMANPPFYCDTSDSIGCVANRSITRPSAKTVSSAARQESQTRGGEVYYCMRIARDSVKYATQVGVFTVMLGKKSSVVPLKRILHKLNVPKMCVYELCQGRIMRWGLAWTFQPSIQFPESEFRRLRKLERPPLQLVLPPSVACLPDYTVDGLLDWLRSEFRMLKIRVLDQKNRAEMGGMHLSIWAHQNTWTHSRRKRREVQRSGQGSTSANTDVDVPLETESNGGISSNSPITTLKRPLHATTGGENDAQVTEPCPPDASLIDGTSPTDAKRPRLEEVCEEAEAWDYNQTDSNGLLLDDELLSSEKRPLIIHADVFVDQELRDFPIPDVNDLDEDSLTVLPPEAFGPLSVRIAFVDGTCREAANQIVCYLRNHLC